MKTIFTIFFIIFVQQSFANEGWPHLGSSKDYKLTLENINQKELYLSFCSKDPKDPLARIGIYKHYSSQIKKIKLNDSSYQLKKIEAHFEGQYCDKRVPGVYTLYFIRDHQEVGLRFTFNPYYPGRYNRAQLIESGKLSTIKITRFWSE